MAEHRPAEHGAETRSRHHAAVCRGLDLMRRRLSEKVTVQELAAAAYMSPYHFVRVFHEHTGLPPARFLTALRIQWAKGELLETRRSVGDICLDAGYSSLGTFTSRFTRLVGLAPAHFRDLYRSSAGSTTEPLPGPPSRSARPLRGTIEHDLDPEDLHGEKPIFFAGLFGSEVPWGMPLAHRFFDTDEGFCLDLPEDGAPSEALSVCVLALPRSASARDYFYNEKAILAVAFSDARPRSPGPRAELDRPARFRLRPIGPLDPPILLALPLLIPIRP